MSNARLPDPPVVVERPEVETDRFARHERGVNLLILCVLALVIGVATGVGAVALRALIGLIHNIFYNGEFSLWYNANVSEGPSRFGAFVLLSPILGGLVVVFLVRRFAPEAI